MGLDITAYSRLERIGLHVDGWCEDEDHIQAYAYDDFPLSFRGIPVVERERSDQEPKLRILRGGCYATTHETQTHRFRAGSYTGYNHWRADLQAQFNPDREVDGPFYELIWFADNEGCIGPVAAADLLADFREHAERYSPPTPRLDWWPQKYADWTRAAELAADGGLIHFH